MPKTLRNPLRSDDWLFPLADLPLPLVYAEHRIIVDCNEAFADLFAASQRDIVGRSFSWLYPEIDDFICHGKQWAVNFLNGRDYRDERMMARLDGERFWCRVRGRSLSGAPDPFERATYCFEAIARKIAPTGPLLSERQRQVLAHVAQGKTSYEIAAEIGLSPRTIEAHRARLMRLIGARNTAELMAWFLEQ